MTRHERWHSWQEYGKRLLSFGTFSNMSLENFIKSREDTGFDTRALLVCLLSEVTSLRKDLKNLPDRMAKASAEAPLKAAMRLADKERRAAEAKVAADASCPPVVQFVDMDESDICEAENLGRVRRKF